MSGWKADRRGKKHGKIAEARKDWGVWEAERPVSPECSE